MKGKIVKTNGVDWQGDFDTARDQFLSTTAHLKTTIASAQRDLTNSRISMLLVAQKKVKHYFKTCKTWAALYTTTCLVLDTVYGEDKSSDAKRYLWFNVARDMGLQSSKAVPPERIAEMRERIQLYLENNL